MDGLLAVLASHNNDMPFTAFVAEARAAGANPALWHRAKMQGGLHTYFAGNGELRIKTGSKPVQGGA